MRSTPIFVAALVGVASAGMPKWALQSSKTGGPGFEKPHSGDMFPSSGPENRYHQKYHNNPPFIFPSGGTGNPYHQKHHNNPLAISGGPGKPHYQKDHHRGPSPPTTATANSNISGPATSTFYDTTTFTSIITTLVPRSSSITIGKSTYYSTSMTISYITTTVTQTSTTYQVTYPSITVADLGPNSTSIGGGSGLWSNSSSSEAVTSTPDGSMPSARLGSEKYPVAPGNLSNGCPAVQTVTSTVQVTVTVMPSVADQEAEAAVGGARSSTPASKGPFSTTSDMAPFPIPSALLSGTGAPSAYMPLEQLMRKPSAHMPPENLTKPNEGYAKSTNMGGGLTTISGYW